MSHYKSYEDIIFNLDMLTSGKELSTLPGGERLRSNEYGDLFEIDIPNLMYGDRLKDSTVEDDIEKHIDRYMDQESYDFKAPKRRGGVIVQGEILVESKNVQGNKGWLYGEEKYLMIGYVENNKFWFLKYDRQKLADWVDSHNVKWLDSRKDRKDRTAWIVPPGPEGGLVAKIRIGKYVDEALYQVRSKKFDLIRQLHNDN